MNFLERALAAALKSAVEDVKEIVNDAGKKLEKFGAGVDKTIEELDEISQDGKTKRK